jgi:hypothetical protein
MAVGHESVEGLNLSKEATAALFDGFQTLQNMGVAAQAMAQAAFTDAAIREIVSAIQMLEEDVHEGEPVCTAFLCASPERLKSLLTDCFVKFEPGISLVDEPTLRAAAQLVNGFDGALLLSSTGHVHGAMIYPPAQVLKDPFLPARFHKVAAAAIRANGFVVLFAGGGRVVILDRGVRVLTRRFAKWHLQGIPSRLREIEAEHGLVSGLLNHALKVAFALADTGCGAILTLGDAERVAAFAGKLPPAMFKWQGLSLSRDDLLPLLFLARQDGATVVTENGIVKTTMTILQPPVDAKADEEADRGARHTTASKISSATAALTIAVSEDGTITLYSKGGRILRVMG